MAFITSVRSAFGHRFYGTDGDETCLTCGAIYRLVPDDDAGECTSGTYQAANGDDPTECTGRTDLVHGEAPCEDNNGRGCEASQDGPCEHEAWRHGCNCLLCTG